MEPAGPPLHPDLAPVAFLLGTWQGEGKGEYPTIEPFRYGEELRFWHVGKPFLAYSQRTWAMDDGRPLHAEMGYWRPRPTGRIELVLAHTTGVTEIAEGTIERTTIRVASTKVERTSSAKEVTAVERTFELRGDVLWYELGMAAVGTPMARHVEAELRRA